MITWAVLGPQWSFGRFGREVSNQHLSEGPLKRGGGSRTLEKFPSQNPISGITGSFILTETLSRNPKNDKNITA